MPTPSTDSSEPLSILPSRDGHKPGRAKLLIVLGALVLLASQVGLYLQLPPFPTWFYVFAWWSWILFADGVVHLRTGSSLLLSRPRSFLLLLPWSLAFWLSYEAANFLLLDWYYVFVPADPLERAIGILVSFATVLPGVLETVDLLAALGFAKQRERRPLRFSPRGLHALFIAGLLFLVLPLVFPDYAYPLIWGAVVLLAEPLLFRAGKRCYLTQFASGDYSILCRHLVAGLSCGLLWEFWNYWATAKWIYTVPFFEEGKLFEMPVLGFLGYPPFALGIYSFVRALVALRLCPEFERTELPSKSTSPAAMLQSSGVVLALLFSFAILPLVEQRTVRSTRPTVVELLANPSRTTLATDAGWTDFASVTDGLRMRESETLLGLTTEQREELLQRAALMQLAGLGERGRLWLASVGVESVKQLASLSRADLEREVLEGGEGPPPKPYAREVRVWHRRALAANR